MTFRIGQPVVCVCDDFEEQYRLSGIETPRAGRIYTVRKILRWTYGDGVAAWSLLLEEVLNPVCHWELGGVDEHPFWVERFRPLVENKTNISALTALLNPLNHTPLPEDELERICFEVIDEALR